MEEDIMVELDERLHRHAEVAAIMGQAVVVVGDAPRAGIDVVARRKLHLLHGAVAFGEAVAAAQRIVAAAGAILELQYLDLIARSEEHTSELQSLMRISYAVFCLEKKKNKQHQ